MVDITRRLEPFRVADWLSLAAAPTFALMAVVTSIFDSGAHQMACSATMHVSPLTGMVPMYVLMSGFHFTPWLLRMRRWRIPDPYCPEAQGMEGGGGSGTSLERCSADAFEWWAVLGSNQWPLPCETEVGCLRIKDMRVGPPTATRTWCHLISLDITQCHGRTVPKLSQRSFSRVS